MKVYLDLYFLINYILDISILIGTSKLLKYSIKFYRYLLGGLVGSTSLIVLFINNNLFIFIIKIIISILMIITTFGVRNIYKNIFYFYIISIIIGGFMYLLDLNFDYTSRSYFLNYLVLIVLSPLILIVFIKDFIKCKNINTFKYLVEIKYNNFNIKTYGIVDTGNCLTDPYKNRGVILIDYNVIIDNPIYIPFKTINSTGIIKCFIPDKLIINDNMYDNYIVGISTNKLNLNGCRCILPNNIVEVT